MMQSTLRSKVLPCVSRSTKVLCERMVADGYGGDTGKTPGHPLRHPGSEINSLVRHPVLARALTRSPRKPGDPIRRAMDCGRRVLFQAPGLSDLLVNRCGAV